MRHCRNTRKPRTHATDPFRHSLRVPRLAAWLEPAGNRPADRSVRVSTTAKHAHLVRDAEKATDPHTANRIGYWIMGERWNLVPDGCKVLVLIYVLP